MKKKLTLTEVMVEGLRQHTLEKMKERQTEKNLTFLNMKQHSISHVFTQVPTPYNGLTFEEEIFLLED